MDEESKCPSSNICTIWMQFKWMGQNERRTGRIFIYNSSIRMYIGLFVLELGKIHSNVYLVIQPPLPQHYQAGRQDSRYETLLKIGVQCNRIPYKNWRSQLAVFIYMNEIYVASLVWIGGSKLCIFCCTTRIVCQHRPDKVVVVLLHHR